MSKLFLDERELRAAGLSERNIRTLRTIAAFVDLQTQVSDAQNAIDTAATDIAGLVANDEALQAQIDAMSAAAPSFTAYAGQTVSAGYVQAEAQATDDAVKALAVSHGALITALQTAGVLT